MDAERGGADEHVAQDLDNEAGEDAFGANGAGAAQEDDDAGDDAEDEDEGDAWVKEGRAATYPEVSV